MNFEIPGIVKISIFYALGILLFHVFSPSLLPYWLYSALAVLLILSLIFHQFRKGIVYKRLIFGIAIISFFALFGFIRSYHYQAPNQNNHYLNFEETKAVKLQINDLIDDNGGNYLKSTAHVLMLKNNDSWQNTDGEVLIYLKKTDYDKDSIKVGDIFFYKGTLNDLWKAKNPTLFDYEAFLKRKNIYAQVYLNHKNSKKIENKVNGFLVFNTFRESLIKKYEQHLQLDEAKGLMAALVVGYRGWLGADIKSSFSNAGLIHVLAVSGLHVGIIFLMMGKIFFFLDNKYPKLKIIIILLFIWMYVLLAGLSPSVMRAGVMFSFISIAKLFDRKSNIYANLAASAFAILLFNPNLILDAGFQLSYAAVAGIVYFYPKIKRYFIYGYYNKVSAFFSDLFIVAIAAQIATFPFILFYFHQFPNYFFISNVVIMPLMLGLIYFGFAASLFMFWDGAAKYFALAIDFLANILVKLVQFFAHLPYAVTENIFIEPLVFVCLILVLFSLVGYINSSRLVFIRSMIVFISIIHFHELYQDYHHKNQKKLTFFYDTEWNNFVVINSSNALIYKNGESKYDNYSPYLKLKKIELKENIQKSDLISFYRLPEIMAVAKNDFIILEDDKNKKGILNWDKDFELEKKLDVDIICVSNDAKTPKNKNLISTNLFVISSNNKHLKSWKKLAYEINANIHVCEENGYLELEV